MGAASRIYLGLVHELDAAVAAEREALERIKILRRENREGDNFAGDLESLCRVNLARHLLQLGRPADALEVLGIDAPPTSADLVLKRAFRYAEARALLDLSQYQAGLPALHDLQGAASISSEYDYPQFTRHWPQVVELLGALGDRGRGSVEVATKRLNGVTSDWPEFWEARFILATTLAENGEQSRAEAELTRLQSELPKGKMPHPEAVDYNLGNLLAAREDFIGAEEAYRRSMEARTERSCRHAWRVFETDMGELCRREEVCAQFRVLAEFADEDCNNFAFCEGPEPESPTTSKPVQIVCASLRPESFDAALNNLAAVFAQRAEQSSSEDERTALYEEARTVLETGIKAAEDDRGRDEMRLNLSRVLAQQGRESELVTSLEEHVNQEAAQPSRKVEAALLLATYFDSRTMQPQPPFEIEELFVSLCDDGAEATPGDQLERLVERLDRIASSLTENGDPAAVQLATRARMVSATLAP